MRQPGPKCVCVCITAVLLGFIGWSLYLSPTKMLGSQQLCSPQQLSGISMRTSVSLPQIHNSRIDSLDSFWKSLMKPLQKQRHSDSFRQEHAHLHAIHTLLRHAVTVTLAHTHTSWWWAQIGYVIHGVCLHACWSVYQRERSEELTVFPEWGKY